MLKCYKQNEFVESVWRASSVLFIFTFRPIAFGQLNTCSLTIIDIFIELCGTEVTHPPWVQYVPGSDPGSGRVFMF